MLQFKPQINDEADVWQSVGIPARGDDLYHALNDGLSYDVFTQLIDLMQIDKKDAANVVHLAPATLARRAKAGKFTREEGDKLYRLTEVLNAATELFEGSIDEANQWLKTPTRGLGGRKPIEMLATAAESKAVLDLIGRLEHGVFA